MTSFINTMYGLLSHAQAEPRSYREKANPLHAADLWLTATTMHERVRAAHFSLKGAPKVLEAGS
jgi:hypothetical protein